MSRADSDSTALPPMNQQRLFRELGRLHDAHVRIEARLQELLDGQKAVDSFIADSKPSLVGLMKQTPGERHEGESQLGQRATAAIDDSKTTTGLKVKPTFIIDSEHSRSEVETPLRSMSKDSSAFVSSSLPLGWPRVLNIRRELNEMAATSTGGARVSIANSRSPTQFTSWNGASEHEAVISRYVIDPNSKFHMVWSIASVLLLIWDLSTLPYLLAWDIEFTGALYVSSWLSSLFWTIDLIVNYFTAFYSGGELQQGLKTIWRSYARSWFAPDLMAVICDWLSIAISKNSADGSNSSRSLRLLRFSKIGRLLRIIGLMRVLRLVRIVQDFAVLHLTELTRLGFQLLNLMLGILWVAHILACLWFGIGTGGFSDTGARWAETFEVPMDGQWVPLTEAGRLYQYSVSLHWACAQVALGSFDVMPTNSFERVILICAMMFGFLFGSTLVSSLSAAMMDYQMMQKDKTIKLRRLRRYLSENGVEAKLFFSVTKQAEQRLAQRTALDEKDVTVLNMISSTLRSHLRFEIQKPFLSSHPIFRLWASLDPLVVHRICGKSVGFLSVRQNDDLFIPGNAASVAYILVSGRMMYTQSLSSSAMQNESREEIHRGQWMCEAALWVQWTCVGLCEATTPCKLLEINAAELIKCLQLNMLIRDVGLEYGKQFHKRVISACPPHSSFPTDLHVPFTDYCDLVVSMSHRVQVVIGQEALRQLSVFGFGRGLKAMGQLEREVNSSKSVIVVEGTGDIIRVVSLIVLQLTNENGEVLTQVGKWSGSNMKGVCQLPGLKQDRDELVEEAIDRFFELKMPALIGKLEYLGISRQNSEKASKEYGVQTKYFRSVCAAQLKDGEVLESPTCDLQSGNNGTSRMSLNRSEKEQQHDSKDLGTSRRQLLFALRTINVQVLYEADGTPNLFAWLSPERASMLGSSSCEHILQKWISSLELPEAMIETCEEAGTCGGRREHL